MSQATVTVKAAVYLINVDDLAKYFGQTWCSPVFMLVQGDPSNKAWIKMADIEFSHPALTMEFLAPAAIHSIDKQIEAAALSFEQTTRALRQDRDALLHLTFDGTDVVDELEAEVSKEVIEADDAVEVVRQPTGEDDGFPF